MYGSVRRSNSGSTAIEYGLIAGLIALGIFGSLFSTRSSISDALSTTASKMASPAQSGNPATVGKSAYNFSSQIVTARSTFTGSNYGLAPGQTETDMNTNNGYITYTNAAGGNPMAISLNDRTINNGQTVYYRDGYGSTPEKITEVYVSNGVQYQNVTTFSSDGVSTTIHTEARTSDYNIDTSKTMTFMGSRSDFSYILNQIPVAKAMAGY